MTCLHRWCAVWGVSWNQLIWGLRPDKVIEGRVRNAMEESRAVTWARSDAATQCKKKKEGRKEKSQAKCERCSEKRVHEIGLCFFQSQQIWSEIWSQVVACFFKKTLGTVRGLHFSTYFLYWRQSDSIWHKRLPLLTSPSFWGGGGITSQWHHGDIISNWDFSVTEILLQIWAFEVLSLKEEHSQWWHIDLCCPVVLWEV